MRAFLSALVIVSALFSGCTTQDAGQSFRDTPMGGLIAGQTYPDEYLQKVEEANIQAREAEKLERNSPTERALNTATGRYEYVPKDTKQRWNEQEQRWEFTPERE